MLASLLLSLAAIEFPGGDVSDLAKSIAEATKQNVVFQAGASEKAPAFAYDPSDLNAFTRTIQNAAGFKRAPGADQVFHHGRLGSWSFGLGGVQRSFTDQPWTAGGAFPAEALKDGKVTFQTKPREAFSIDQLPQQLLSKTLEVHWVFDKLAFKASVKDMPARDFVNFLAKAVGGKVITRQDRFVLDLDPAEVQRRAVATLVAARNTKGYAQLDAGEKLRMEMSRAYVGSLSSQQIAGLLSTPQTTLRLEIGPALRPSVKQYVTALMDGTASGEEQTFQVSGSSVDLVQQEIVFATEALQRAQERGRGQGRRQNYSAMLRRLDPRLVGYATIDARFRVRIELLTLDNYGRASRLIRLP